MTYSQIAVIGLKHLIPALQKIQEELIAEQKKENADLLSIEEAQKEIRTVTVDTLYRWARENKIPVVRNGSRVGIRKDVVETLKTKGLDFLIKELRAS